MASTSYGSGHTMSRIEKTLLEEPSLEPALLSRPTVMTPGVENPYPLIVCVPKTECQKIDFEEGKSIQASALLSLHCCYSGELEDSARHFGLRYPKIVFANNQCYFCFGSLTIPDKVKEGTYYLSVLCQFFQPFRLLENGRSSGGLGLTGRIRTPVHISSQGLSTGVVDVGPEVLRLFVKDDENKENQSP